jgi:predicted nucleic acid-binding protein
MHVVADASVLVAELLRVRGRALVRHPELRALTTEEQWSETQHELNRRLRHFIEQGRVTSEQSSLLRNDIQAVIDDNVIEVAPRHTYHHLEAIARRRIPRDPNDWPSVALALALGADILTEDHDFLGCGVATWTFQTLRDELTHG